jgi:hypothetical protein
MVAALFDNQRRGNENNGADVQCSVTVERHGFNATSG